MSDQQKAREERRETARSSRKQPGLGIIFTGRSPRGRIKCRGETSFVYIHNLSEQGAGIESTCPLDAAPGLELQVFDRAAGQWQVHPARIIWQKQREQELTYLVGLSFMPMDDPAPALINREWCPWVNPADIDFLLRSSLLENLSEGAFLRLINCLTRTRALAGERFINQGEPGEAMYIIQDGACIVQVTKEGQCHQVARLGPGDIVGEMAVLTGEPRCADVIAETNVDLWELSRANFEKVATEHPDLRMFLTELVTKRLESSSVIADRTIGRYVIKNQLGRGGWGIVYFGTQNILGMPVAIKMLRHDMAMDADFQDKFRREAGIVAKLNHRNIVQVYDIEERYRTIFIVMEYLEGRPVADLIKSMGRIPPEQAATLLTQVCRGLAYAHAQGIVHQDIKPDNLFVQSDNHLKILDFGLACPTGSEDLGLAGTVHYAAPEQIEGTPVDQRTDIFALGVTAFEMVCGHRPFQENDLDKLMGLHCEQDIPDPCSVVPELPPELRRFILTCCGRDPRDRYPNADQALEALGPLIRHDPGKARPRMDNTRLTTLFMVHEAARQNELNHLVEEFSLKVQELGVSLKAAHFRDL